MKTYELTVPITGVIYITVRADSKEEAIEKALESAELTLDKVESWSGHRQIVQGNFFYGEQNQIEVTDECDEDEE